MLENIKYVPDVGPDSQNQASAESHYIIHTCIHIELGTKESNSSSAQINNLRWGISERASEWIKTTLNLSGIYQWHTYICSSGLQASLRMLISLIRWVADITNCVRTGTATEQLHGKLQSYSFVRKYYYAIETLSDVNIYPSCDLAIPSLLSLQSFCVLLTTYNIWYTL